MQAGSVLAGRYRLDRTLCEGGMGRVWAATHIVTHRALAVKQLLLPSHAASASEARARFVLEARSACALEHPHVVDVLDLVDDEGEPPLLVMELLRGETLAEKLAREERLSVEEAIRILLPVVSAVGAAHARGIIHRDLKPSNIFLSDTGASSPWVKVLDFGIAKWLPAGPASGLRTGSGALLGTPSYMAPEQATNERPIDHRADIWSLGVVLYECVSGIRPVEGNNPAQVLMRLSSSGIMPLEQLVPGIPQPLAELVASMLEREPSERPRDLGSVFEVLGTLTAERAPAFGAPCSEPLDLGELATALSNASFDAASSVRPAWQATLVAVAVALVLGWALIARRLPAREAALEPWAVAVRPAPPEVRAAPAGPESLKSEPRTTSPSPPRSDIASTDRARSAPPARASGLRKRALQPAAARQETNSSGARAAPSRASSPEPRATPLPRGSPCETSRQCQSQVCLALRCA